MPGYIKIPRDLFASPEWTSKPLNKVSAQIDLLQMASFIDGKVLTLRSGEITLNRGQLFTTARALSERWGWHFSTVSRFLAALSEKSKNCIRIQIERVSGHEGSLITICDYDEWCATPDATLSATPDATNMQQSNCDKSEECNDVRNGSATPDATLSATPDATNNNKLSSNVINNYTHSKILIEGVVGGDSEIAAAANLVAWVQTTFPALAAMKEPLTVQQAIWILRKYTVEDARYLLASIANKDEVLRRNRCVYTTFVGFAKREASFADKYRENEKCYTYEEMCDYISAHPKSANMFCRAGAFPNGMPAWKMKRLVVNNR